MPTFPFISLPTSLIILRVGIPLLFIAHALVRIFNGSIPGFAQFLQTAGFPQPLLVVWSITLIELIAGTLLAAGYLQRYAALALGSIAAGGIVLIHGRIGWFVGEHGSGGSEYSVCLLLALLVLAAADSNNDSNNDSRPVTQP